MPHNLPHPDYALGIPLFCPECDYEATTHEELGAHLERHAPVRKPIDEGTKAQSRKWLPCPKKCGRWFPQKLWSKRKGISSSIELKAHVALCDGSEPLKPEDCMKGMVQLPCGHFAAARWKNKHKCNEVKASSEPKKVEETKDVKNTAGPIRSSEIRADILQQLKDRRSQIQEQVLDLDSMIDALEKTTRPTI